MVTDDPRARMRSGKRPQAGERLRGRVLVEAPDGGGDLNDRLVRLQLGRTKEGVHGGDRSAHPLETDAVQQPLLGSARLRPASKQLELALRRETLEPFRTLEVGDERRTTGRHLRVENVLGAKRGRGVGIAALDLAPLAFRGLRLSFRQQGEAEVKPRDAAVRMLGNERPEARGRPRRPRGDRGTHGGLDGGRVRAQKLLEANAGGVPPPLLEHTLGRPESARLLVVAEEQAELERRGLGGRVRGALRILLVLGLEHGDAHHQGGRSDRSSGDEESNAHSGGHAPA